MTTIAAGLLKLPLVGGGGAYLRFLPPAAFRLGSRHLIATGASIVLYVNPWEIDSGPPRQQVGWKVHVNHYFNLGCTKCPQAGLLKEFHSLETVLGEFESKASLPGYRFG